MGNILHVLPVNDAIGHEKTEDCACQPQIQPVECNDGTMGWLIVHAAWDGRS